MRIHKALLVLPAFMLIGACAATPAEKVADGSDAPSTTTSATVDETPTDEVTLPEDGKDAGAMKVGDTASVDGWKVTVTVTQNVSNSTARHWNSFNDKAENGSFVLVDYKATYAGDERKADAMFDLTWTFGGTDGVVYDSASVVTEADNKSWPTEARKGGSIKSQVIFDVPRKVVPKGLVSVEGFEEFADFTL
jgi:hypothetical protein